MAILYRNGLKADLESEGVEVGEIVFATDTEEHGWKSSANRMIWNKLGRDVLVGTDFPSADEGKDGSIYIKLPINNVQTEIPYIISLDSMRHETNIDPDTGETVTMEILSLATNIIFMNRIYGKVVSPPGAPKLEVAIILIKEKHGAEEYFIMELFLPNSNVGDDQLVLSSFRINDVNITFEPTKIFPYLNGSIVVYGVDLKYTSEMYDLSKIKDVLTDQELLSSVWDEMNVPKFTMVVPYEVDYAYIEYYKVGDTWLEKSAIPKIHRQNTESASKYNDVLGTIYHEMEN